MKVKQCYSSIWCQNTQKTSATCTFLSSECLLSLLIILVCFVSRIVCWKSDDACQCNLNWKKRANQESASILLWIIPKSSKLLITLRKSFRKWHDEWNWKCREHKMMFRIMMLISSLISSSSAIRCYTDLEATQVCICSTLQILNLCFRQLLLSAEWQLDVSKY